MQLSNHIVNTEVLGCFVHVVTKVTVLYITHGKGAERVSDSHHERKGYLTVWWEGGRTSVGSTEVTMTYMQRGAGVLSE